LPFLLSSGAKRLVKNIGDEGRYLEAPEPGAVISWHRSVMPWAGHVGIVESHDPDLDELVTIEGNKRTAGRKHALVDRFTYRRGEWRQKLHRIASI
jgi:hypothetical protein